MTNKHIGSTLESLFEETGDFLTCGVCGKSPAPYEAPSKLTPEQQEIVRAYHASFTDEHGNLRIHTGHLPPALMELPTHLCEEHKPVSKEGC